MHNEELIITDLPKYPYDNHVDPVYQSLPKPDVEFDLSAADLLDHKTTLVRTSRLIARSGCSDQTRDALGKLLVLLQASLEQFESILKNGLDSKGREFLSTFPVADFNNAIAIMNGEFNEKS